MKAGTEKKKTVGMFMGLYNLYLTCFVMSLIGVSPAGIEFWKHPHWIGFIPITTAIILLMGAGISTYFLFVFPLSEIPKRYLPKEKEVKK